MADAPLYTGHRRGHDGRESGRLRYRWRGTAPLCATLSDRRAPAPSWSRTPTDWMAASTPPSPRSRRRVSRGHRRGRRHQPGQHPCLLRRRRQPAASRDHMGRHAGRRGRLHARRGDHGRGKRRPGGARAMGVDASHMAARMAWMAEANPELWAATAQVLLPKDWVIGQLTGAYVSDPSARSARWGRAGPSSATSLTGSTAALRACRSCATRPPSRARPRCPARTARSPWQRG
jgi:hypothetical protein